MSAPTTVAEQEDRGPEPYRCRRAHRCGDREPVRDENGDPTGQWVGAGLPTVDGLCPICISAVDSALIHLPGDVVELTDLIGRDPAGSLLETVRVSVRPPEPGLPILEHVEALRALIVHEADSWATSVAREEGVAWSTLAARRATIERRTEDAAKLLRHRLSAFLALGPVEHRARSLTTRRGDGHDPDIATRYNDDYWIVRTGLDGALVLLGLHERAWTLADRSDRAERMHLPCKSCGWPELRHEPGGSDVWCAHCRARAPWDDYCVLREHAVAVYAVA